MLRPPAGRGPRELGTAAQALSTAPHPQVATSVELGRADLQKRQLKEHGPSSGSTEQHWASCNLYFLT